MGTSMFWTGPNQLFNQTLLKMEPVLASEGSVGYIDVNELYREQPWYPLEFTSRFGYPTISIQQAGMLTPIGQFFLDLADGNDPKLKTQRISQDEIHIEDVKQVNGQWLVAGTSGVILIVIGMGPTMRQAQSQVYSRIKNVLIPNMYYRTEIGDRWVEDTDRLHTWGYLR
jgi:phosphoribosylamine--glycine ligase